MASHFRGAKTNMWLTQRARLSLATNVADAVEH
jgi:hypothetical protein